MRKYISLLLALVMVLDLFAGCGSQGGSTATTAAAATSAAQPADTDGKTYGDPIIFGLTTPVTGAQAAGGEQAKLGMQLKIDEVNAAGGIELSDGWHLIELQVEDDQGDSTLCDTTVRRLFPTVPVLSLDPTSLAQLWLWTTPCGSCRYPSSTLLPPLRSTIWKIPGFGTPVATMA